MVDVALLDDAVLDGALSLPDPFRGGDGRDDDEWHSTTGQPSATGSEPSRLADCLAGGRGVGVGTETLIPITLAGGVARLDGRRLGWREESAFCEPPWAPHCRRRARPQDAATHSSVEGC